MKNILRRSAAYLMATLTLLTQLMPVPAFALRGAGPDGANLSDSRWRGRRVAFLGDSITDPHHVGTTRCYWEFLADMLGIVPLVYGVNGHQMSDLYGQAQRMLAEQGDSVDAIVVFAGTNDYNGGVPLVWYGRARDRCGRRREDSA